mgnify:CR=1 FL=1
MATFAVVIGLTALAEVWATSRVDATQAEVVRRLAPAALRVFVAMAWALGWIAVGRLSGEPASLPAAAAAVLAGLAILAVTAVVRARGPAPSGQRSAAEPARDAS